MLMCTLDNKIITLSERNDNLRVPLWDRYTKVVLNYKVMRN